MAEFPKLNYRAIYNVFDVVNIRPYWKIYRLQGKSDQGFSGAQNTEMEFATGLPFAKKTNKKKTLLRLESKSIFICADYTTVYRKFDDY